MASRWARGISLASTETVASPERQIRPVSRSAVERDSLGFAAFRIMRLYPRWFMELFFGLMQTRRPVWALVLRKMFFSVAVETGALMSNSPWGMATTPLTIETG